MRAFHLHTNTVKDAVYKTLGGQGGLSSLSVGSSPSLVEVLCQAGVAQWELVSPTVWFPVGPKGYNSIMFLSICGFHLSFHLNL